MYLHYAEDSEAQYRNQDKKLTLARYAASLTGLPALPGAIPQALFQLVSSRAFLFPPDNAPAFLVREQLGPFFGALVEGPAALPLLAIRAARQAVAANPRDGAAWLRLGQAYLLLRSQTCERSGEGLLPPLAQLRHVQIATALEQAIQLDPDLEKAHHELAYHYGERNYRDISLEHRREELRLSRRTGARAGETAEETADRLELLNTDTEKLEQEVQERRKVYATGVRTLQGGRSAEAGLALRLGLARFALEEVLMQTPADVLGPGGVQLELDLLLGMGRAAEVRTTLSDERMRKNKQGLLYYDNLPPRGAEGAPLYILPYHWPAYDWLHALAAAALGDYGPAGEDLRTIGAGLQAGASRMKQQHLENERQLCTIVPELFCGFSPLVQAYAIDRFISAVEETETLKAGESSLRGQLADLFVLSGMLALEKGDTFAARAALIDALEVCAGRENIPFAARPIATHYLGKLLLRD